MKLSEISPKEVALAVGAVAAVAGVGFVAWLCYKVKNMPRVVYANGLRVAPHHTVEKILATPVNQQRLKDAGLSTDIYPESYLTNPPSEELRIKACQQRALIYFKPDPRLDDFIKGRDYTSEAMKIGLRTYIHLENTGQLALRDIYDLVGVTKEFWENT